MILEVLENAEYYLLSDSTHHIDGENISLHFNEIHNGTIIAVNEVLDDDPEEVVWMGEESPGSGTYSIAFVKTVNGEDFDQRLAAAVLKVPLG